MAAAADENSVEGARFTIVLPGGRVAKIPQEVVETYVVAGAEPTHSPEAKAKGSQPSQGTTHLTGKGDGVITINIYTQGSASIDVTEDGQVGGENLLDADDDVVAHSMSVDAMSGSQDWHTDWEQGECEYTDDSGMTQSIYAWHRHPFGTEYAELYEG